MIQFSQALNGSIQLFLDTIWIIKAVLMPPPQPANLSCIGGWQV